MMGSSAGLRMASFLGAAMGGTMGAGMPGYRISKGSTPNKYANHKKFGGAKEIARRKARMEKA
jgi:hypothetical protein